MCWSKVHHKVLQINRFNFHPQATVALNRQTRWCACVWTRQQRWSSDRKWMRWDSGWVVESRYQVGWKEFRKDSRWKNTNKKREMTLSPDNISQKQTTYFPAKGKICTLFFKLITLIALCRLHSDVVLPMLFCEIPTFFWKIYQVIEHDPNLIPQSYSWSLLIILTDLSLGHLYK